MWRTACGECVMTGAEAELLRSLIDGMVDSIEMALKDGMSHITGVVLFDQLQPTQQMAMLCRVAHALLDNDIPEPELTAVNEATVYAIFRELYIWIQMEIDGERMDNESPPLEDEISHFNARAITLAAYQHRMPKEEIQEFERAGYIPDVGCRDMSEWDSIIEGLADRILWDRDFDMEYLMADEGPGKAEVLKSHLGIDEGYYTAIAPEISDNGFMQMRDLIRNLVRV